jgi:kumamolisin
MKSQAAVFLFTGALMMSASAASAASSSGSGDTVEVILRLNGKISMKQLAKSVTDPSSPRYREFYTNDEIRALAAPADADYNRLIAQLKNDGAVVVKESPSHLFVTVRGDRAYLAGLQSQTKAPLLRTPSFTLLASVHGLDPSQKRQPRMKILNTKDDPTATGFQPSQIKKLYDFTPIYAAGFTGKGQHIAIATYDSFYVQDVLDYYKKNQLTPGASVDQVNFNGTAVYDPNSAAETQTDAEFSGMIAPGASIHVFTSAQNSDAGELAMFTAILDDGRAKIVNYSWGSCEPQLAADHKTAMDAVFARAVAQGVNVFVASGDSGSDCQQNGTVTADFPASQPNVVAVGGTTLTDKNGVASEVGWSGSGGGISTLYAKPAYQAALPATYAKRSYPDVAFNADPNSGQSTWVHYNVNDPNTPLPTANYVQIGGTSIAAPQWAGFMALVGEARGGKTLGFLNTLIYGIPAADQNKYFDDVSSGSNGAFTAAQGWDAVTGFGSMRAGTLLTYLQSL